MEDIKQNLGPLANLAGIWEGDKGDDISLDDDRVSKENNKYRERITFELLDPVNNHEQTLYGYRYTLQAFRLGVKEAFHDEVGYWVYDPKDKQVMRCFVIPRAVTVNAGGFAEPNATKFEVAAEAGSQSYGICSNKFLDKEFKTVRFTCKVEISKDTFAYEQDTQLQVKGQKELFHHTDKNTLKKVK